MEQQFYYEFSDHDYYALIVVTKEESDLYTQPYIEAAKVYVDVVSGDSVREVLDEAHPNLRTKEFAFEKFLRGDGHGEMSLKEVIKQFDESKNEALLIDSAFL